MDENIEIKPMGQVIQIDEGRIKDYLGEMVRGTVEETLKAMLDAEADHLCGTGRHEREIARKDTRAGSYERRLETKAGEVNLKVAKLRRRTCETAIIERYFASSRQSDKKGLDKTSSRASKCVVQFCLPLSPVFAGTHAYPLLKGCPKR